MSSTLKEHQDSDADLDVDGDDTLEYGKAQYPHFCCQSAQTVAQQGYHFFFFFVKAFLIIRNVSLANDLRYTEADVIPCSGNEPRDAEERQALRGAVLKYAHTNSISLVFLCYFNNTYLFLFLLL